MKLKLSDRMQAIANHVDKADIVADIGTDHGYIPIWLTLNGRCRYAILADINEGPLKKAEESIKKYADGKEYDIRLGSGIEVLMPGEADTVIIAGMGGILIKNILSSEMGKTMLFSKMILQPRNNAVILRKWLKTLDGFAITCEEVVKEADKFCEIITVKKIDNISSEESEFMKKASEIEKNLDIPDTFFNDIPAMLIAEPDSCVIEYLEKRLSVTDNILKSILNNGKSENISEQLTEIKKKKINIEKVLNTASGQEMEND